MFQDLSPPAFAMIQLLCLCLVALVSLEQDSAADTRDARCFIDCTQEDHSLFEKLATEWDAARPVIFRTVAEKLLAACRSEGVDINGEAGPMELLTALGRVCGENEQETVKAFRAHAELATSVKSEKETFEAWVADVSTITDQSAARQQGKQRLASRQKEFLHLATCLRECEKVGVKDFRELNLIQKEAAQLQKRIQDMALVNARTRLAEMCKNLTDEKCCTAWKAEMSENASMVQLEKAAYELLETDLGSDLVKTLKLNYEDPGVGLQREGGGGGAVWCSCLRVCLGAAPTELHVLAEMLLQ